jgi:hypothetical protein
MFRPHNDYQSELGIDKNHRWDMCSRMTTSASMAAGAVYRQENRPKKNIEHLQMQRMLSN